MSGERYFLDTNVLVYANDRSDTKRQRVAARLLAEGIRNRTGVLSPQVLSEFWVTVTRKIKTPLPLETALAEMEHLGAMMVAPVRYDTVMHAVHLEQRYGINYWDALILAAARAAGCALAYSEDLSDGQSYDDVRVENPFR